MTDLIERLYSMQGMGDVQLKALMDGVGPKGADEIKHLRAELMEQCRLLGMSAEREAKQLAQQSALEKERDALKAWKEEVEKQEPVGVLHVGSWYGEELQDWEFEADQLACDRLNELHCNKEQSVPLYAHPIPAQSVPTALLVAIADLVAELEIVSRVGYVDMPDDKDSCASFCVAEGTWLELVSCVESLASALAAAPKPEVK